MFRFLCVNYYKFSLSCERESENGFQGSQENSFVQKPTSSTFNHTLHFGDYAHLLFNYVYSSIFIYFASRNVLCLLMQNSKTSVILDATKYIQDLKQKLEEINPLQVAASTKMVDYDATPKVTCSWTWLLFNQTIHMMRTFFSSKRFKSVYEITSLVNKKLLIEFDL